MEPDSLSPCFRCRRFIPTDGPALCPRCSGAKPTEDPEVKLVQIHICVLCLGGKGGECHAPGCAFYLNRAPDLPINPRLYDVVTPGAHGVVDDPYGHAEDDQ